MRGARRIRLDAQRIVNGVLRAVRQRQKLGEITDPLQGCRHRIVDVRGTRGFPAAHAGVSEEEEQFVLAVIDFRENHRPADGGPEIIVVPARCDRLRGQLVGQRVVTRGVRGGDLRIVILLHEKRRGIPVRVQILLGQCAVHPVRAGFRRHLQIQARGVPEGRIEIRRLHFELFHHVRVGREGGVTARALVGLAVHRPFITAHVARREITAGTAADLSLREILRRPRTLHARRQHGLQNDVVRHHRQIHQFTCRQRAARGYRVGLENRRLARDSDRFRHRAHFQFQVDGDFLTQPDGKTRANHLLKARCACRHLVRARLQQAGFVKAD